MTFIPERFRRRVLTHAIAVSVFNSHPMLLAIQGPPGDGKSYQTSEALKESNFEVFRISSSLLSGRLEGASVEGVKSLYRRAGDYQATKPSALPALILEDFDMSPASQHGDSRYTVNSQLLAGYLMNLADDVGSADVKTRSRYPIFLTGNDFTFLHGPLVRPGRADFFTWQPNLDERGQIVHSILSEYLDVVSCEASDLSLRFRKVPISAFRAAVQDCFARRAYDFVSKRGAIDPVEVRRHFDGHQYAPINLQEISDALARYEGGARQVRSFLRGGRA